MSATPFNDWRDPAERARPPVSDPDFTKLPWHTTQRAPLRLPLRGLLGPIPRRRR